MEKIDANLNNIFGFNLQMDIDKKWLCSHYACNSVNLNTNNRCQKCTHQKPKHEKSITSLLKKIWNVKQSSMFSERPIKHLIVLLTHLFDDDRFQIAMNKEKQQNVSKLLEN